MYEKRVKVFIAASLLLLGIGILRLVQMQLLADSSLQDEILALKRQRGQSKQLRTLRGQILDREGRILATDAPRFQVTIDYQLSRFWDLRVIEAKALLAQDSSDETRLEKLRQEVTTRRADLEQIIGNCTAFGVSREYLEGQINSMNDKLWNLRTFLAWYRSGPDPNLVAKYGGRINSIPPSEARADFEKRFPDRVARMKLIAKVDDLRDMYESRSLLDLRTDDDIFAAQLEFMDINDVEIVPQGQREYPYRSVAAQTIGWVGEAKQDRDKELFKDDHLASYLPGDICGRRPGIEYVCEAILRGRRGEQVRDIDGELVRSTETQFGHDVQLTLDIELQREIEEYLTDPAVNPEYYDANMAAVVIQIRSGDVLALVSLPTYDLNRVSKDYTKLAKDPNWPLRNRAINEHYPPGSSVKPVILVAGMESGAITADEPISCPSAPAPGGWPNCLIYRRYGSGHDNRWTNDARNAIRGSCNVYFSRLANRLEPADLQSWLFRFGYGHPLPLAFPHPESENLAPRRLLQAPGLISSQRIAWGARIESLDDVPPLAKGERPYFGIGQGNLRATPLQVANSFATLARGGRFLTPRLVLKPKPSAPATSTEPVDLQISPLTLRTVYEGMDAVVNKAGGTAHEAFALSNMAQYGVKVYGKTGSTEDPEHAWFAGFAEDAEGAEIAIAVIVEGGQSGSRDAAPLGREIIQLCIQHGHVGTAGTATLVSAGQSDSAAN